MSTNREEIIYREAQITDVPQIQIVRNAVKENTLSDPALIPDEMVIHFLTQRGKGWVAIVAECVVGFSIVDLMASNVWALFLLPEWEGKGIGQQLHEQMLLWYFSQSHQTLWLGTTPNTRAEKFYLKAGWQWVGWYNDEHKFEMTKEAFDRNHS